MEQLQFPLEQPRKKRKKRRAGSQLADAAFVREATKILQWTLGPKPPAWRVYRLARALREAADGRP